AENVEDEGTSNTNRLLAAICIFGNAAATDVDSQLLNNVCGHYRADGSGIDKLVGLVRARLLAAFGTAADQPLIYSVCDLYFVPHLRHGRGPNCLVAVRPL